MQNIKDKKSFIINIIIFAAILIFINLISVNLFKRFDFSKGHIYSLSDSSKDVLKKLKDRLTVKAYFSENLPGQYADTERYTKDLLAEYQAYSSGNLHYESVPAEAVKEEARKNRIQPVRLQVLENDKMEVREVYMGLAFFYQDKKEIIPLVQSTRGLEYDITSTIKKITSIGLSKVGFFKPEEEEVVDPRNPNASEFQTIKQLISENYEMSNVKLDKPINEDVSALLFSGISDSLTENQLKNLDSFITRGGNVVFLQDRIDADLQGRSASVIKSNIFKLLEHYGINIKPNLIQDAECTKVGVKQKQGIFVMQVPVSFPFFPEVNNMNKDNPIVANLENLLFYFASELDTTKVKEGVDFEPLLYTSEFSDAMSGRFRLNYQKYMNKNLKTMFNKGPKVLAGLYEGQFPSYYSENSDTTKAAKIIVLTDKEFIKEISGAGGQESNTNFVLNSLDYLSGDTELLELRSREKQLRPLKEVSDNVRKAIKWINILLPAMLLIIFGLIRYRINVKKRKLMGKIYE